MRWSGWGSEKHLNSEACQAAWELEALAQVSGHGFVAGDLSILLNP